LRPSYKILSGRNLRKALLFGADCNGGGEHGQIQAESGLSTRGSKASLMVKLIVVDKPIQDPSERPIGVFQALAKGFDLLTARPYLMLPPLLLDLYLWFGLQLRLPSWTLSIFDSWTEIANTDPNLMEQFRLAEEGMRELVTHVNLVGLLSSLPVGIPSLMFGRLPIENPLGLAPGVKIDQGLLLFILWFLLMILGQVLGGQFHFWLVKHLAEEEVQHGAWGICMRLVLVGFLLQFGMMFSVFMLLLVASIAALILPILGLVVGFMGATFIFWAILYLVFTPHGIVRYRLGIFRAMMESVTVVRWNLLGTVGFLALSLLIMGITNQVWVLPSEDSWYTVLAILGHALVATTLLAGSYVFYQGRREWMLAVREARLEQAQRDRDGRWRA